MLHPNQTCILELSSRIQPSCFAHSALIAEIRVLSVQDDKGWWRTNLSDINWVSISHIISIIWLRFIMKWKYIFQRIWSNNQSYIIYIYIYKVIIYNQGTLYILPPPCPLPPWILLQHTSPLRWSVRPCAGRSSRKHPGKDYQRCGWTTRSFLGNMLDNIYIYII